jgi:hypothetical protein
VIAPLATPAKVLTAAQFKDTAAVADLPSSKLIDCPVVLPPRDIGPDELRVMYYPYGVPNAVMLFAAMRFPVLFKLRIFAPP